MDPAAQIKSLKEQTPSITLEELAARLNADGVAAPGGGDWSAPSVSAVARKAGVETARLTFSDDALERILSLKESGCGLAEIGETLAREGLTTPQGGRWWPATVRKAIANAASLGNERAQAALANPAKRKTGSYAGLKCSPPEIVARIAWLRSAAGGSKPLHEIADILTEEGVPTARGGRRWWQSTVRSALASANFAG